MKVLTDIPEDYYKAIKEIPIKQCTGDMLLIKLGTPIQDNATNGDMIKAMFPNVYSEECDYDIFTTLDGNTRFTYDWWNAQYKRGNEND